MSPRPSFPIRSNFGRIPFLDLSKENWSRYASRPFLRFLKLIDLVTQLNGAQVLFIDGRSPYVAVDQNAAISGGFQGLGTRQNS